MSESRRPKSPADLSTVSALLLFLLLASHALAGPSPGPHPGALQGPLPGIDQGIEIGEWHYLGPFSVGAREGIPSTGTDPASLDPDQAGPYPSVMVQGGFIEWKTAAPDSTGWISTDFEKVPWDTLMDVYGYAGIVNAAYAFAELESPEEARALVKAEKIGTFFLNGRQYPGDPYGSGYMLTPVVVKQGINRVLVKLTGYGDHRFRFEMTPPQAPVITLDDYTTPDVLGRFVGEAWIGVPLLNTTTRWLRGVTIEVGDDRWVLRREANAGSLAPLCVKKVPMKIGFIATHDSAGDYPVPLRVICDGSEYADTLTLRLRDKGQSIKRTFISSIDSSCQYYAVRLPARGAAAGGHGRIRKLYGLIFTLHGAGVRAEGQVDAYKAKDWAYVVAPTNRRPFGFDWQDWGRLDALEVLDIARNSLEIDDERIYLTGHSMGGHGVWHVGLAHPDLFAAMAPGAGWTSFDLYVPWFLQKANILGDPAARAVRDRALLQDAPHRFVENARNLPIFILQGGSDDNVPPYHPRLFVQRLEQLGYDYIYKEDPGRGHWWGIDSLDVSCVDDPDLMGFFPGKTRVRFPRHVTFKTANISCSNRAYWVEIRKQEIPYRESLIDAAVFQDTLNIEAGNVKSFGITLSRQLFPDGRATVLIDGKSWTHSFRDRLELVFSKRAGEFMPGESEPKGLVKTPGLYGPIKQTTFSPHVLVYGTQGDEAMTDLLLHQAR
ncbi:MAG: prolyl oligopeptidase family serine peptidase, partial [bacterium]